MTGRIAISQSNYLPWKGYFDLIRSVDTFVLYDEVQYTRRDWRNRNRIKTAQGAAWLTVPVQVKGRFTEPISSIVVSDDKWPAIHWSSMRHAYARAKWFEEYSGPFAAYLNASPPAHLSQINRDLLEIVMAELRICTPLKWSYEFPESHAGRSERLLSICLAAGADTYVSGPAARAYLDESLFEDNGVEVQWFSYDGYPPYGQCHGEFVHDVSVIDLLFNTGPEAGQYLERDA